MTAPKNVEIYSPSSLEVHEKYMKNVTFPWPPFEAGLSIFNFTFCKNPIFQEGINKTKEIHINAEL